MKTWQEIKAEIDRETLLTELEPAQDVLDVFRYSISKAGAGVANDGQIFTTWFFGGADVSYIADWCYFIMQMGEDENFTAEQIHQMFLFWIKQPSEFGHFCGLYRQYEFCQDIAAVMDSIGKKEFLELVDSFRCYLMNINAWVYQYMPWGIGRSIYRKDRAYFETGLELAKKLS